jgi:hypothetical protein
MMSLLASHRHSINALVAFSRIEQAGKQLLTFSSMSWMAQVKENREFEKLVRKHDAIKKNSRELDVINSAKDIIWHEEARKRILCSANNFNYQHVQILCKANGLLVEGKVETLRTRLQNWFHLFGGLDPLSEEYIQKRYKQVFSVHHKEGSQSHHNLFKGVFCELHPNNQSFTKLDLIRLEIASELRADLSILNEQKEGDQLAKEMSMIIG